MGFPLDRAAVIAFQAVRDMIRERHFTTKIAFVCFDKRVFSAFTDARRRVLASALNRNFVPADVWWRWNPGRHHGPAIVCRRDCEWNQVCVDVAQQNKHKRVT